MNVQLYDLIIIRKKIIKDNINKYKIEEFSTR